jgi:hypothetical protein
MILERTAAYVLAVACVFQALRPSWTSKPHSLPRIVLQIGRLRVQATNDTGSVSFAEPAAEQKSCASITLTPLLPGWQKQSKRLRICIDDNSCLTAWVDRTSYAWSISRGEI